MKNINTELIGKAVNKAFWAIAIYAYIVVPIYCFAMYGYLPSSFAQSKDLWDTKNMLLDFIELINA